MITRGQFIEFSERGKEIRSSAKELVFDLMTASPLCQSGGAGMKQTEYFVSVVSIMVTIRAPHHQISNIGW